MKIRDPDKYIEAMQDQLRRERAENKRYTQPQEATWREFLQRRGWTPKDVASLPEDYVYSEWGRYKLQVHYNVGLQG